MEEKKTILKGRLDGKQRNRMKRLLDMEYKPSELASELGINTDQIYLVYIPLGLPHYRDNFRKIMINGAEFCYWYLQNYQKTRVNENQAFCKTCNQAVEVINPTHKKKGGLEYLVTSCPNCGRSIAKIIACKKGIHGEDK